MGEDAGEGIERAHPTLLASLCEHAFYEGSGIDLGGCSYGEVHEGADSGSSTDSTGYYYFLAGLIRATGFRRVLEIGTHWGGSVRAMLRGVADPATQPALRFATADIALLNPEGFRAPPDSGVRRFHGDASRPELVEAICQGFEGERIDLLYVDAEHSYEGTKVHLESFVPRLDPCLIVLDDILINESMRRLWDELAARHGERCFDASHVASRGAGGMGVVVLDEARLAAIPGIVRFGAPLGAEDLVRCAWTRRRLGDLAGALRDCEEAIVRDPRGALAYARRGVLAAEGGDAAAAHRDFAHAVELDPLHAEARLERGLLLGRRGRLAEALADLDVAVAHLDALPSEDGRRAEALAERSRLRRRLGDARGAREDSARALALADGPEAARLAAGILIERGALERTLGNSAAALADLDEAIRRSPTQAWAHVERGRTRRAGGDLAGALADYERALELADTRAALDRAEILTERGEVRRALGDAAGGLRDHEQAIRCCGEAIERDPEGLGAWLRRARLRHGARDAAGALADLGQTLALAPATERSHLEARLLRGTVLREQGEPAKALEDLAQVLARLESWSADPAEQAIPYVERAQSRRDLGDLRGALEDHARAIALLGETRPAQAAELHAARAELWRSLGELGAALRDYDEALRLDAAGVWARFGRARLRRSCGDAQGALEDYDLLLARGAESLAPALRAEVLGDRALLRQRLGADADARRDREEAVRCCDEALLQADAAQRRPDEAQRRSDEAQRRSDEAQRRSDEAQRRSESGAVYALRGRLWKELGAADAALADLERALQLDPGSARARRQVRLDRAVLLRERGEAVRALEDLERVVEEQRETSGLEAEDAAAAYVERGRTRRAIGDLTGALADFERALAEAAGSPALAAGILTERGELRRSLGELDAALRDYDEALRLVAGGVWARFGRARLRRSCGDAQGALEDYDHLLARGAESLAPAMRAEVLGDRALLRQRLGADAEARRDREEAVRCCDEALLQAEEAQHRSDEAPHRSDEAQRRSRSGALYALRGRLWKELGAADAALADLDRALQLDPGSERARRQARLDRAALLRERGEAARALEDLERVVEQQRESAGLEAEDAAAPYVERGRTRRATGDLTGALEDFERALAEAAGSPALAAGILTERGELRRSLGEWDAALRDYDEALRLDAAGVWPRLGRARLRGRCGDAQGALEDCDQLLARGAESLAPLLRAEVLGDRALLRQGLGAEAEARRDREAAVRCCDEALLQAEEAQHRSDEAPHRSDEAQRRSRSGALYALRGRLWKELGAADAALADLDRALQLDPGSERARRQARLDRAVLLRERGEPARALEDLDRVVEQQRESAGLEPEDAAAPYVERGRTRKAIGDLTGALEDFERALAAAAGSAALAAGILTERGALKRELGDAQGALQDYDAAIERRPQDPWAYVERGRVRRVLGERAGALRDFETVLQGEGEGAAHAVAQLELGRTRVQAGDPRRALQHYDAAVARAPGPPALFAEILVERGAVRRELGDAPGALQDYDAAALGDPGCVWIYIERGRTRARCGDARGARQDWERAAALAEGSPAILAELRKASAE